MIEELTRLLGYHFKNPSFLKMALTHRSYEENHNERLEFLGDSIVNLIVAEALYQQFPKAQEGELSRWRANLVNRDALCRLAKEFQLGRYLYLGAGELKAGGATRDSILSCAMEALIGAVYLDSDYDVTRERVLHWYQPLMQSLINTGGGHKDPKTQLQEYLQARHSPLPIYQIESIHGESHQQTFVVSCKVVGISEEARGRGSSRRRAEQSAAEIMLRMMNT